MNNNENNIRIGGIDYSMSFLQTLLDSVRSEYPSFSADMLRVWEDNQRQQREIQEGNLDNAQREQAERNANFQEVKERTTDD